MKTGRLLKLPRPGADVQVYLYRDAHEVKAAVYVLAPAHENVDPVHTVAGATEAGVEAEVRAWVAARFPAE